jgi:hypothetical protein
MHGHEGFAVIWQEAQRRRAEFLGLWFSQIFSRLWNSSDAISFHSDPLRLLPSQAKPHNDRSTTLITAVALLCMTVVLPSHSAIGQSEMVPWPSGRVIGHSQVNQDRLVGTWTYESIVVERTDGTRVAPFGPDPKGFITLSADGRYSLQLIRPDVPKIASKDRLSGGTPEENRAVAQNVLSQFGSYSVNQAEGTLTLHVETSSFPNENGTDHERIITSISVDRLQWTNPTPTTPGIAYSTLSRAKAPAEPPRWSDSGGRTLSLP